MIIDITYLIIGGVMLYLGAEGLVRGSVAIAFRMGISALVIGLTFVAFGTSSPELVVSLSAAQNGDSEIALGNVIGSNIANIALILGAASLIKPIDVNPSYLKKDLIIMLGVSVLMIILISDGKIGFFDGLLFTFGIVAYIFFSFYSARMKKKKLKEITEEIPESKRSLIIDVLFFIGGLAVLIFGARFFVSGAVSIAEAIGVSKTVIGISVVAFGTSLPELATSIVAAIKGESDVSIGNVVGSNIFNILMILGITGLIFPIPASEVNWIDLSLMLGVSFLIIPLSYFGKKLTRIDGIILLSIYGAYIYYLFVK